MLVTYQEFEKVELRAGTVVKAESFDRAKKPAYKVWVDFGPDIGIKQTSAQITQHYSLDSLVGKRVIGCINLGNKNIAGFASEFLLCGFADDQGTIQLATFEGSVPNGAKLC